MNILLHSDYTDFYDEVFCASWQRHQFNYSRYKKDRLSVQTMFKAIHFNDNLICKFGIVKDIAPALLHRELAANKETTYLAVFLDNFNYKDYLVIDINGALKEYPNHFAVEFSQDLFQERQLSYKYVRIGLRQFWIMYNTSASQPLHSPALAIENVFEVERLSTYEHLPITNKSHPIITIDYRPYKHGLQAVRINTAPELGCLGINTLITPNEILKEIWIWFLSNNTNTTEVSAQECLTD